MTIPWWVRGKSVYLTVAVSGDNFVTGKARPGFLSGLPDRAAYFRSRAIRSCEIDQFRVCGCDINFCNRVRCVQPKRTRPA